MVNYTNGDTNPLINIRSVRVDRLNLGKHGTSHGGDRDYYEVLGYPETLTLDDLYAKFERDGLAARIVEFPPDETWRDTPTIKDGRDKDAKETTRFAKAWAAFAQARRVYHYCRRVDTLAGIGRYGVLLIGVAGNQALSTPITRLSSLDQVIYLRPYGESAAEIYEWEDNPADPRFGQPRAYRINLAEGADALTGTGGKAFPAQQVIVHHSRVIHVAEGLLENEVYGRPRLQRPYNRLDDILKVVGGSAEATWKLMRKGFVLNIDPELDLTPAAVAALEEQFDEYDHGLRRYLRTRGMDVSDLGSEVVEPRDLFDCIIDLISADTGIPKRILLGSERGELASSQDASSWAGHVASRQLNFAEPNILRPLIDRLIAWGALQRPSSGVYTIEWDPLFEMTDQEKATVADTWAAAAQKAATAIGGPVMTAEEYRGEFTPFAAEMPVVEMSDTEPTNAVVERTDTATQETGNGI
jgi:hypothetical protein